MPRSAKQSKAPRRSPWPEDEELAPGEEFEGGGPPPARSRAPFVIGGAVVFLLLLGSALGVYSYLAAKPPAPDVSLSLADSGNVFDGLPFTASYSLANNSDSVLHDATLSLILPDGVSFVGEPAGTRVKEISLGDVGPGSSLSDQASPFDLIAVGVPQTSLQLTAKLLYSTGPDSNAQYELDQKESVLVGQPALSLSFQAPQGVLNSEDFNVEIDYHNNTPQALQNVGLDLSYPPIFQIKKSSLPPDTPGQTSWTLGTIQPGDTGKLVLRGSAVGTEGSFFTVGGQASAQFSGQPYQLNSQTSSIGISQAPLSLSVSTGGGADYVAHAGDALEYTIGYKNNSSVTFQNIVITAHLTGAMFDFTSLQTPGSFDSVANVITWLAANTPALQSLPPGGEGSVNFLVKAKGAFPISRVGDKNYSLKLDVQAVSPTVAPGTASTQTLTVAHFETKVGGQVDVQSVGYHRDPSAGISNSGPYPPRVNQTTQYTIHWIVRNYSTDIANVHMEAYLQSGASMTSQVKSNTGTLPVYNPSTGLVAWDIPFIPATRGIVGPPAEAVFQIQATPSVTQAGQILPLVGPVSLTATDNFTSSTLQASAPAVMGDLPQDASVAPGADRGVQQ